MKLPPMNALKAFEAAARTGSYVAAAAELGVSPAAVSQQVKNLEAYFGRKLFRRFNNRITLTDAGDVLFADAHAALSGLSDMTRRLFDDPFPSRLVISLLPSLASRWIGRHLPKLRDAHPGLKLDLRVEEDPVDFARDRIDIRICYGSHLYSELTSHVLFHDHVRPVCSPAFFQQIRSPAPEQLDDGHLIHTSWGPAYASHPTWGDWFKATGLMREPQVALGHRSGMSALAIDLALAGSGIALGQDSLMQPELEKGSLICPYPQSVPLGHPYCLVHPKAASQKTGVRDLIAYLKH